MTRDTLDDLIDRAAPVVSPISANDLDELIAHARKQAPRSRRKAVLIPAGALAVLLGGGVGVAAATDGFTWAPWAQDPVTAVTFTMDIGFQCEIRNSHYTGGADPQFLSSVNAILEDWHQTADVLGTTRTMVPEMYDKLDNLDPAANGIDATTLTPAQAEHWAWVREWSAWSFALDEAESQELTRHGIEPGDPRFVGGERASQIRCFDNNGAPYLPGAGL